MGFYKIMPNARGPVAGLSLLPDPKVVGVGANQASSPDDWSKEWHSLLVMAWEVAGLHRGIPRFLSITAPVMTPVALAWHAEDWPTYQAACAQARRQIGHMPAAPRSTWWPCWETHGRA